MLCYREYRKPPASMDCKTCEELVADYKRSVGFFTKVVHRIPGILGDDARVVVFELDLLRQKVKEAREALMAHFHQDHRLR